MKIIVKREKGNEKLYFGEVQYGTTVCRFDAYVCDACCFRRYVFCAVSFIDAVRGAESNNKYKIL